MSSARDAILTRVALSSGGAPLPSAFILAEQDSGTSPIEEFVRRVHAYRAYAYITVAGALTEFVADVLAREGKTLAVVGSRSSFIAEPWARVDDQLPVEELDRVGAAVIEAVGAVAESGTVVLDGEADNARRALSLVPDVLVVVVAASHVERDLERYWHRVRADRPLTLISGPSATSDIELNRVEGVHGPRRLHVVVVS
jgi:L-lactate dehydrogenase complex protein LldG